MESIEQGLLKLQHQKDADTKKYQLLFAKFVFEAANKSNQCAKNQARQFKKVFPELEDMVDVDSQSKKFNPQFVVEMLEGKATQVIRTGSWDREDGFLPNRQVMDKFYVDMGIKMEGGEHFNTKTNRLERMKYANSYIKNFDTHNANPSYYTLNDSRHNFQNHYDYFYKPIPKDVCAKMSKSVERKEHRELFYSSTFYEWEVDNYLNLYHQPSGLYLMFNKTVFPMLGFHLSKQFTPYIFTSKRLEVGETVIKLGEVLVKSWLEKLDNQPYLLEHISQIIPDNYHQVFDTFNRFRKLDSFQSVAVEGIPTPGLSEEGGEAEDMRDQLIRSYKTRLEETLLRAEKAESYQHQMLEDYRTQSSKLQELQLEIDQKIIMEQEAIQQKAQALVKEHLLKERVKLQELEASKQKTLELQTRLSEKEVAEGKLTVMNSSLEVLKKEHSAQNLKMEKVRNINTNLMANLQDQKKANEKLQSDNHKFHECYLEIEVERNQIQKMLQEKMSEMAKSQQEVTKLTSQLVERGEQSSNCLENALSDQVEQLKMENETTKETIRSLTKENKSLVGKLQKYQKTLSMLTSDLA